MNNVACADIGDSFHRFYVETVVQSLDISSLKIKQRKLQMAAIVGMVSCQSNFIRIIKQQEYKY